MNQNGSSIIEPEAKVKQEEEKITIYRLGDEKHQFNPDDEEIEFIGERICALENLEKCKNLKVRK